MWLRRLLVRTVVSFSIVRDCPHLASTKENAACELVPRIAKSASKPGALAKIERFFFDVIPAHGYT
jgi:hypothetical protein